MIVSVPQKVSLALLGLVVMLLLAPYAGCNHFNDVEQARLESSAEREHLDFSALSDSSSIAPKKKSSSPDKTLDQIDELLSN